MGLGRSIALGIGLALAAGGRLFAASAVSAESGRALRAAVLGERTPGQAENPNFETFRNYIPEDMLSSLQEMRALDMESEADRRILAPLVERLPPDFLKELEALFSKPEQDWAEGKRLARLFEPAYRAARLEAGKAVKERTSKVLRAFLEDVIDQDALGKNAARIKKFDLYGPEVRMLTLGVLHAADPANLDKAADIALSLLAGEQEGFLQPVPPPAGTEPDLPLYQDLGEARRPATLKPRPPVELAPWIAPAAKTLAWSFVPFRGARAADKLGLFFGARKAGLAVRTMTFFGPYADGYNDGALIFGDHYVWDERERSTILFGGALAETTYVGLMSGAAIFLLPPYGISGILLWLLVLSCAVAGLGHLVITSLDRRKPVSGDTHGA